MTIIPDLLATGIAALAVSIATIVWSLVFVQKRQGGWMLLVLAIAMLLVGGGFGPPALVLLAGVAGLGINAPYTGWRRHLPTTLRAWLAGLWPWVFGICAVNGVFLVVGHVVAAYLFAPVRAVLFVGSFFFAVVTLLITILAGTAHDIQIAASPPGPEPHLR